MNIGIVNDTPLAVEAIRRVLQKNNRHCVIWVAEDGAQAVASCQENTPDLVLMDLVMPGMNGMQATQEIMRSSPTAILAVTASVDKNCSLAFGAMGAGALDVICTPTLGDAEGETAFLRKIDQIQRLTQSKRLPSGLIRSGASESGGARSDTAFGASKLIAIGCSAGGPAALSEILGALPQQFDASIIIVQHIDEHFINDLATWLNGRSACPLRLAIEGDRPRPGEALLANTGGQLLLSSSGKLYYGERDSDCSYFPSVDGLFSSIARYWRGDALGIILTGMGRDGSQGLLAMKKRGFCTVAQDQTSSSIYGMPKAAMACGAASEAVPLNHIADRISRWIKHGE